MAITRAQHQNQLVPSAVKTLFGLEYNQYPKEHLEIYKVETMAKQAFEEEQKISGFGLAQLKEEGHGTNYDTAKEEWKARYVPQVFSLSFAITEEAIDDNQFGSLTKRYTKAAARSMAHTREIRAASLLNLGFTTFLSGDGVALMATNHPLGWGGTVANRPAIGSDLNETSLEAAVIQIAQWTDDRGLLIAAQPRKLIVPVQLQFIATRLLKNPDRPGTADRDINAIVKDNVIPEGYCVNHWLTSATAWFLKTDVPDGLKLKDRRAPRMTHEGDFETKNMKFTVDERNVFGVTDPLGIWGNPGV